MREAIMKGTIILAATLLTTLAVTGVMNPSRSIAVPTSGIEVMERIGHGGSTYSSSRLTSDQPVSCTGLQANVNIEARIGHGGSTYPYGVTMTD
jgi:hypothetical protein